jgi:hypothetical protein
LRIVAAVPARAFVKILIVFHNLMIDRCWIRTAIIIGLFKTKSIFSPIYGNLCQAIGYDIYFD